MAAYRRVYDSRHLQADCQEPGSAPEPYVRQSSMGYLLPFKYYSINDAGLPKIYRITKVNTSYTIQRQILITIFKVLSRMVREYTRSSISETIIRFVSHWRELFAQTARTNNSRECETALIPLYIVSQKRH